MIPSRPLAPPTAAGPEPLKVQDSEPGSLSFSPRPTRLLPGDVLERYRVEAWLGDGGAASVYRVRHRALDTLHALKVPHLQRPELLERLLREGKLQAGLVHPNIIRVQDILPVLGGPALLMDYAEGQSLAQRLAGPPMRTDEITVLFRGILEAVAHAHAHGIVHRDLKPANVMLTPVGDRLWPRVTDFGIARILEPSEPGRGTETSGLLGTPEYMAPEQLRQAHQADGRADLFSLGVILYELCCGRRPFSGPDLLTLLNQVASATYVPPENVCPELPQPLVRIIRACLVASVDARASSCATLLRMLEPDPMDADPQGSASLLIQPPPVSASDGFTPTAESRREDSRTVSLHEPSTLSGAPLQPPLPPLEPHHSTQEANLNLPSGEPRAQPLQRGWLRLGALRLGALRTGARLVGALLAGLLMNDPRGLLHLNPSPSEGLEHTFRAAMLQAEAWKRAEHSPAEALALLLAAEDEGIPLQSSGLDAEALASLLYRGAASRVIPAADQVVALASSPDASRLAGGLISGAVQVWSRQTGKEELRIETELGRIDSVRFTPDGRQLIVVPEWAADRSAEWLPARSFDARTGRLRYTLAHGGLITRMVFSPDGTRAITVGWDPAVRSWNLETGSPEWSTTLPGNSQNRCSAVSSDGKRVAVSDRQALLLLELQSGALVARLPIPHPITGPCELIFGPENQSLVLDTRPKTLHISLSGTLLAEEDVVVTGRPLVWQVSPDGSLLLRRGLGNELLVNTFPRLAEPTVLRGHPSAVVAASFSAAGDRITSASSDGEVVTWEMPSRVLLGQQRGHHSRILALTPSPRANDRLIATGSRDRTVRLWEGDGSDSSISLQPLWQERSPLLGLTTDGRQRLYVSSSGEYRLQTLDRSEERALPGLESSPPTTHAFSSDGALLALRSSPELLIYTLGATPRRILQHTHRALLRWLEFSPDQTLLLGMGDDPELVLIPITPDRLYQHLKLPGIPYRAAFVPGTPFLLVGTRKGALIRVDTTGAAPLKIEQRGPEGISALHALPDGTVLVGEWSGALSRWDSSTLHLLATWPGHQDGILGIESSPLGGQVATLSWDRTVRLWDVKTGALLRTLPHPTSDPTALAFTRGGQWLATGTRDGRLRLYELATGLLVGTRLLPSGIAQLQPSSSPSEIIVVGLDGRGFQLRPPARPLRTVLEQAGRLTNLRVCPDSLTVVPVIPFPEPEVRVAPASACTPPRTSTQTGGRPDATP